MQFNKKGIYIVFTIIVTMCLTSTAFATTISVGGTSQEEYNTTGNCVHRDASTSEILVDKFISYITYDSYVVDPKATKLFQYEDTDAWEKDLLDGTSYNSIDDVDFMIFSGHGFGKGLHGAPHNMLHFYTMNSSSKYHPSGDDGEITDYSNVDTTEADWGKSGTNTKWVALFSCNFLNDSDTSYTTIMQGVHSVMGFGTVMWVDSREGQLFGNDLRNGDNIIDAFLDGASKYQGANDSDVKARVIYADISRDDTISSYSSKPNSIYDGSTNYYVLTRTIPTNQ